MYKIIEPKLKRASFIWREALFVYCFRFYY